ncbi:MAG TPA: hypothetical protein VD999_06410 [Vitreimonas sp.]|nr:hypothetical protein [Vitreimonas sp.]
MSRRLIVTHHAPDLDAIGAVWLLKRFDSQHYADAKIAFVNPGDTITLEEAEEFGVQLHEVTHVDTGLSEFDHHQPDRGLQYISATSLVYDHICKIHPDLVDDKALKIVVEFTTETDHLGEVHWPDASSARYNFMIHELIRGTEFTDPHTDDSQLHFGMMCLDSAYASLKQHVRAAEIVANEGIQFDIKIGKCLAVETRNDDTIKLAQKQGYVLVIRKDPEEGNIRIKARPDVELSLNAAAEAITKLDTKGSWYNHPSGKMLINGSRKHRNQKASPLTLNQVIEIIKRLYS